jgi:hypothetical protein
VSTFPYLATFEVVKTTLHWKETVMQNLSKDESYQIMGACYKVYQDKRC